MGEELEADYYNGKFSSHWKYQGSVYESPHFDVWKEYPRFIGQVRPKVIIDLGCGPGYLAELIRDKVKFDYKYIGYDFSKIAIKKATERLKDWRFKFKVRDLRTFDFVPKNKEVSEVLYIACEYLEHISDDIGTIKRMPEKAPLVFSVPDKNNNPSHVRFFKTGVEVSDRYLGVVDIVELYKTKRGRYVVFGFKRNGLNGL